MQRIQKITPCLWFDGQAEEAANTYTAIFPNSRLGRISRFTEAGYELHQQTPGSVMTVEFFLDGQSFTALNGGPLFRFNEAISFQVSCDSQREIDEFWEKLSAGGDPDAQQCGWLKDRFGVSWQIVPAVLADLLQSGDAVRNARVLSTLFEMKKIDIAILQQAAGE